MIELINVEKTYPNGFQALKPLNLTINESDIMGIIGYSGAGKSTLIRLINRLEEASKGDIIIDNQSIISISQADLAKMRRKIGMIFQHFNLLDSRNVFGNVAFALEIAKWRRKDIKDRVNELLDLVGLSDKAEFYPSQLSGGQKQRVAIARALANYPKILLCDEATSALDTKTTKSILALLKDIQNKVGLTVVLITHQIEVVRQICNKMCVISNGEIIERGSVEQIFSAPKHDITKELIAFLPAVSSEDVITRSHNNVYKISFVGKHIHDPLISEVIKKFNVNVNILAGNIEALRSTEIGYLYVDFDNEREHTKNAIAYLENRGLIIELINNYDDIKAYI